MTHLIVSLKELSEKHFPVREAHISLQLTNHSSILLAFEGFQNSEIFRDLSLQCVFKCIVQRDFTG
jgi:hypothetical protein